MKTVKWEDAMKVTCPVCKSVLVDDNVEGSQFEPCKHVVAHHCNIDSDNITRYNNSKAFEKAVFADKAYIDDADTVKALLNTAKKSKMQVVFYDGGYMGGCCYDHQYFVFKK